MGGRYFTPEEANELLASVRPLAERMVAHRRALTAAERRQGELIARIAGNGSMRRRELATAREEAKREAAALARCVEAIHELGGLVKDLERGLVDFPARRGEEEVLLCWHVGEDEITHWHGVEEGFGGRKPLPLDD
ncbi:MAG: DUF2203 domain-containing protein [Actinomycetota bacterium]|nr:DUF2203 domain-containing protein [Actinomycetota bacterium]